MRITLQSLLSSLGYCCPRFFFQTFRRKPTWMIALRLGLDPRTIRYYRAAYRAGQLTCEGRPECLLRRVRSSHTTPPTEVPAPPGTR